MTNGIVSTINFIFKTK